MSTSGASQPGTSAEQPGRTRVEVGGTHAGWPYAFDGSSTGSRGRSGVLGSSEKSNSNASRWNSWHIMGFILGGLATALFGFEAYKAHR